MKENERMWVGIEICEEWVVFIRAFHAECNNQSREEGKCG